MSTLLGRGSISFHHACNTISLETKAGGKLALSELCKSVTPPCKLNPLLFNGHLQTACTVIKDQDIPIYYKRKVFEAEDPTYSGTFAVDFVVPPNDGVDDTLPPRTMNFTDEEFEALPSSDTTPMLILLHGLSGGSHELYLRHVLAPLTSKEGGWQACVINSRGCAMSKITSGVLYNARATWDMRQMVQWLHKTFPNRPLFAIGFSLGANILTVYCGEEGENCLLKAAIVCSNPWNLELTSVALQQSWLGLHVYSKVMAGNMKRLFEQHVKEISKNPRVNVEAVRKVRYLHEFDRQLQGPTWGYPTEGAYYRDASSVDALLAVRVPFFAINAEDDPIALQIAIPYEEFKKTPYAVLCTTNWGGHLSWYEIGGGRWFAKPAVNFLQKLARDIDLSRINPHTISAPEVTSSKAPETMTYEPMCRKLHKLRPFLEN